MRYFVENTNIIKDGFVGTDLLLDTMGNVEIHLTERYHRDGIVLKIWAQVRYGNCSVVSREITLPVDIASKLITNLKAMYRREPHSFENLLEFVKSRI